MLRTCGGATERAMARILPAWLYFGMRKIIAAAVIAFCPAIVFAESAAGLRWTAPAGWKNAGPSPMRAATYSIAPAQGDQPGAECVVNYFGPGDGGSVEANIERWKNQMHAADGKTGAATVATRNVRGIKMTTIDASGAYSGMGGPMATIMGAQKIAPGYRLLGAIVEGPGGNVFLKLVGPAKTIATNQKAFEQLLASFQTDK
jgi:hypothetical protein